MADSVPASPGSDPAAAAAGNATPPSTGSGLLFSRYRVQRELGRGGMGAVLLAHDEKLGQPVAIKVIPDNVVHDEEAIERLRKEVLRGMALTHTGIARTNHFEHDQSGAAIVMEFIEGQTLAQLMREQPDGCFDSGEILPWLTQLAAILDYAHTEVRIAHRDLKPGNIMITPSGRVKVADFGLASALEESQGGISVRADGAGTPQYMSPQQFTGEPGNRLDDIYSLGATIYALLTGKPPFFRGNIMALLAQVKESVPPSINDRRAELGITTREPISAVWEEAVAACLAKDPTQRPPSVGNVIARLLSTAASSPSGDGADTQPMPPPLPVSAGNGPSTVHPSGVALPTSQASQAGFVGTGSTKSGGVVDREQSDGPSTKTDGQPRKTSPWPWMMSLLAVFGLAVMWHFQGRERGPEANKHLDHGAAAPVARSEPTPLPPAPATPIAQSTPAPTPTPLVSPATVLVTTEPAGARLSLDDLPSKQAPARFDGLAPGRHQLVIALNGYISQERTVTLRAGQVLDLDLIRLQLPTPSATPVPINRNTSLTAFLSNYYRALGSNNVDDTLAFYADKAVYRGSKPISQKEIRKDFAGDIQRWPVRHYRMETAPKLQGVPNSTLVRCEFVVYYEVYNSKVSYGRLETTIDIDTAGSQPLITRMTDTVIMARKDQPIPPNGKVGN